MQRVASTVAAGGRGCPKQTDDAKLRLRCVRLKNGKLRLERNSAYLAVIDRAILRDSRGRRAR
jgi:hypothetical protein